jgi:hypothetical protein
MGRAGAGFDEVLARLEEPPGSGIRRRGDALLQTAIVEAAHDRAGPALNAVKQAYDAAEPAAMTGRIAGRGPDLDVVRAMIRMTGFRAKDLCRLRRTFARSFHPDLVGQQGGDGATVVMAAVNCMIDDALLRADH